MNCIKCNGPLLLNNYCSECGVRQDYYKKANNTSNWYYNHGLDKAQVRDLSGAIEDLKISLKYNKYNTNARNLLGLIHYEMGEVVLALSEWVVSNHFQPDNNEATDYLDAIQSSQGKLETVNQTIKKYNQTLTYAQQKSEDLALIQLKKVLSLSPNFVNGYLLLSLLYINAKDYEKAKKALRRVLRIDTNNTLALKYMHEVGDEGSVHSSKKEGKSADRNNSRVITESSSINHYVEPASGMRNIIYIALGVIIGLVVMWVLIIPNKTASIEAKYKNEKTTYSDDVAKKNIQITSLEEKNKTLEEDVAALQKQVDKFTGDDGSGNVYDKLFTATKYYFANDKINAAKELKDIKVKDIKSQAGKEMYTTIAQDSFVAASTQLYQSGYASYSRYRYEEAKADLEAAYELNDQNVDALYFLARSYHQLNDKEKALEYYDKVINDFPTSSLARKAQEKKNSL